MGIEGNVVTRIDVSACGLHLLGRLDRCPLAGLATAPEDLAQLIDKASKICRECDLCVVAHTGHFFGPDAVTVAICLAESHLTFHTWPELGRVYLDVFVCSEDQSGLKAKSAFDRIAKEIFASDQIQIEEVSR